VNRSHQNDRVTTRGLRGGGALALVATSLLWGTTGTAASFLPVEVGPVAIGASTMAVGGLLLFIASARRAVAVVVDRGARRWLAVGAVAVVVYPLAFYSAMDAAGVAIGNVIALGSGPVFAALLEWVVERRALSARWAVATAVAIAGVALVSMSHPPDAAARPESTAFGVCAGLVAGLAYAVYTYASGRVIARGHGAGGVLGAIFGLGAIGLVPVLLLVGEPLLRSAESIAIASYLAIGPMFLAYLLFGFGIARLRSSVVTTITLAEPVVATVLAVAIVGERLGASGWAGVALILLGVTIVSTARRAAIHSGNTGSSSRPK
jgi:DME family drug/metabolite transporter